MNDGSKQPQEQDNYSISSAKKVIDFELLWRCTSKIWNESMRCMRGRILKQNNTIMFKSGVIEYSMFILFSMSTPLEFVSGEIEDVPWSM